MSDLLNKKNIDAALLEITQIQKIGLPKTLEPSKPAVEALIQWIYDYLCQPHPELGRKGPVCPFVPTALEKKTFFLRIYQESDLNPETVRDILRREKQRFEALEPKQGSDAQFKTILIMFPHIPKEKANCIVDWAQSQLKHEFVPSGLMVGEFHPGPPPKGGLWNDKFRPLNCPVPLIAIRHMVPTDVLFLKDEKSLISEYLKRFGDNPSKQNIKYIAEAAEKFGFDIPGQGNLKPKNSPTVIFALEQAKISYKVHRHADYEKEINTPQDFAEELNYAIDRISKALFIKDAKNDAFFILTVPAASRVDLKKVASFIGSKRLSFASKEELEKVVGYPPKAVTPIGVEGVKSIVDERLLKWPTILTGGGVEKMEIEISPKDLISLTNSTLMNLDLHEVGI